MMELKYMNQMKVIIIVSLAAMFSTAARPTSRRDSMLSRWSSMRCRQRPSRNATTQPPTKPYKPKLELQYVGQPSIGIGAA